MSIEIRDFWTRPDLLNAFKLTFSAVEERGRKADLLVGVLRELPAEVARLEFFDDTGTSELVVLFTHDYNQRSAIVNEGLVLAILIEAGAVPVIGSEGAGASEDLDGKVRPYRVFPSADSIRHTADFLLRQGKIGTCVYAAMITRAPLLLFGLEDKELYERAVDGLVSRDLLGYADAVSQRPPILANNLLVRMREAGASIAGATVTEYNYQAIRRLLVGRISCAGVRSLADDGPNDGSAVENLSWFLEEKPSTKRPKASYTASASDPLPTLNERIDEDRRPETPLARLVDDGDYGLLNRSEPFDFDKKKLFRPRRGAPWRLALRLNASLDFTAATRAAGRGSAARSKEFEIWCQEGGPVLTDLWLPVEEWEAEALDSFGARSVPRRRWRFLLFTTYYAMARYCRAFRVPQEPIISLPLPHGLRIIAHWHKLRWSLSASATIAGMAASRACSTASIPVWLALATGAVVRSKVMARWAAPQAEDQLLRSALAEGQLLIGGELLRLRWDVIEREHATGDTDFGRTVGLQAASILDYLVKNFPTQTTRFLTGVRNTPEQELFFEDCFLMRMGKAVDRWFLSWQAQPHRSGAVEVTGDTADGKRLLEWFALLLGEIEDAGLSDAWRVSCLRELSSLGWANPLDQLRRISERETQARVRDEIQRCIRILERP